MQLVLPPGANNSTGPSRRLILASASPRRQELLSALGAHFEVIATSVEEEPSVDPVPSTLLNLLPRAALPLLQHPTLLAWRKAAAAAIQAQDAVVIGADTIVVLDGMVFNKPLDAAHAQTMLAQLAGRTHTVYTGLCVLLPVANSATDPPQLALVAAEVTFAPVHAEAIAAYVATGEPLDKAGAYGVQGMGGRLVQSIHGSYTAVVGFPLVTVHTLLGQAGITGLANPDETYYRWLRDQGKEPLPWPPTLP